MTPLLYSNLAKSDLIEIWNYSKSRWGAEQAYLYGLQLEEACKAAATGIQKGREIQIGGRKYRRVKCQSHFIFGREVDDGFLVVRVLHERMNPDTRL